MATSAVSLAAAQRQLPLARPTGPGTLIGRTTWLLLLFVSVYGLMSVFVDNLLVRSIKDVLMLLFAGVSILHVIRTHSALGSSLLALIGGMVVVGAFGVLTGIDVVAWVYGVKITILPLLLLFLGMYIAPQLQRGALDKVYLTVFLAAIGGWLAQYLIGMERLMAMGFVYGVNIKHFADGMPRLSSIAFSPDNYAYLLAIAGLLLERSQLLARRPWLRLAVKLTTGIFLMLSTIRSALVLWLVSQLCLFLLKLRGAGQGGLLWLALLLLAGPTLGTGLLLLLQERDLLAVGSTLDRFGHWGDYLVSPLSLFGMMGFGLGAVGAASKRTVALGRDSGSYAVDNQYLALYEQIGVAGVLLMTLLTVLLMARLLANLRKADSAAEPAGLAGREIQTRPRTGAAGRETKSKLHTGAAGREIKSKLHTGAVGPSIAMPQAPASGPAIAQRVQVRRTELAIALIAGGLFAGLTTNVLELFPYNVFLWLAIGGCLLGPDEMQGKAHASEASFSSENFQRGG
ncbi:hypothetical protein [Paenibacillus sp. 1P07SE]|uniref:hypothetical protein n=1 Tax=Paenibacillus sp. 1P07SE TaxID=3132209 RepID=UPI0039A5CAFC